MSTSPNLPPRSITHTTIPKTSVPISGSKMPRMDSGAGTTCLHLYPNCHYKYQSEALFNTILIKQIKVFIKTHELLNQGSRSSSYEQLHLKGCIAGSLELQHSRPPPCAHFGDYTWYRKHRQLCCFPTSSWTDSCAASPTSSWIGSWFCCNQLLRVICTITSLHGDAARE